MTTLPCLHIKWIEIHLAGVRAASVAHTGFTPRNYLGIAKPIPNAAEEYRPGIPDHEINREKVITAFYDVSGMRIKYHKSVCALVMAGVPLINWEHGKTPFGEIFVYFRRRACVGSRYPRLTRYDLR